MLKFRFTTRLILLVIAVIAIVLGFNQNIQSRSKQFANQFTDTTQPFHVPTSAGTLRAIDQVEFDDTTRLQDLLLFRRRLIVKYDSEHSDDLSGLTKFHCTTEYLVTYNSIDQLSHRWKWAW